MKGDDIMKISKILHILSSFSQLLNYIINIAILLKIAIHIIIN